MQVNDVVEILKSVDIPASDVETIGRGISYKEVISVWVHWLPVYASNVVMGALLKPYDKILNIHSGNTNVASKNFRMFRFIKTDYVNNGSYEYQTATNGIPQGSILGPCFFRYVNNINITTDLLCKLLYLLMILAFYFLIKILLKNVRFVLESCSTC